MAIGVIFALVLIFSSGNKFLALIYGMAVIVFIYLLSILTYMPPLDMPSDNAKTAKNSRR